jgi:hypothetical protein
LSPFGYGEVAWRDYEAVLEGSLLVKPESSHLETNPDIFRNGETYAAIAWDFADMGEIIQRFLRDEDERLRLADNAYRIVHEYVASERFVEHMAPLFDSSTRRTATNR